MTPADFKAARVQLRLTQAEIAHILNASVRSIQRWEASDWDNVSPQVARIMEWMLNGYRPAEFPRRDRLP